MEDHFLRGPVAAMELKKDNNVKAPISQIMTIYFIRKLFEIRKCISMISDGLINTFYMKPKYGVLLPKIVFVLPEMHL